MQNEEELVNRQNSAIRVRGDYREFVDRYSLRPLKEKDFLSRNYKRLFLFPFVCILLAVLIMSGSKYPNAPHEDREDFLNVISDVQNTANLIFTIGVVSLSFLLFIAPFLDLDFHIAMKISLLALGVLLLAHFLTGGFKFQVLFG
ncbi:MAG: hypothetical protein MUC62_08935 [Candidatus Thermoplasmatota archaeon]|nr:hypothetical protein [Candidatus Thermoplasmatota archaeon]